MPFRPRPGDFIRFLRKVRVDPETGCWLWQASVNGKGYGRFKFNGENMGAHRFARQAFRGAFRGGIQGNHRCRVPHCVNPDHINGRTLAANVRDGNANRKEAERMRNRPRRPRPLPTIPDDGIPF